MQADEDQTRKSEAVAEPGACEEFQYIEHMFDCTRDSDSGLDAEKGFGRTETPT